MKKEWTLTFNSTDEPQKHHDKWKRYETWYKRSHIFKIHLYENPEQMNPQTESRWWLVVGGNRASQVALVVKNLPANAGDLRDAGVWSLAREDPWEEGNDNPLQYSCLENPTDRGAWWGRTELDTTKATGVWGEGLGNNCWMYSGFPAGLKKMFWN